MSKPFSVTVYCASQPGKQPEYLAQATAFGGAIAKAGARLVYGGGGEGLMGAVADGAMRSGGEVLGVIPQFLVDREKGKQDITELQVVPDMHVRKMTMFNEADAFVILPGGLGTLEELFEILTWKQLGQHDRPIVIFSPDGFYSDLRSLVDGMLEAGFLHSWREDLLQWAESVAELEEHLSDWVA